LFSGYRAEVIYEEDNEVQNQIPQIQHEQEHLISTRPKIHTQINPNFFYTQPPVKQLKQRPRFTVTPTPYSKYSHIRAPHRKSYSSTTSLPSSYY
jgi:hypothetical protein